VAEIRLFSPHRKGVSDDLNPSRMLNMQYHFDPYDKAKVSFLSTSGLRLLANVSSNGIRGSIVFQENLYVVTYNAVIKLDSTFTKTTIGNILTFSGNVGIAENGQQMMIVDGANGYIWNGTTFVRITSPDFPGADFVVFKDGYFIYNIRGTGRAGISASYNGLVYDALDVKTAEAAPDKLRCILADQSYLWMFGVYTTELWYNAGSLYPFQRSQNGVLEWGIVAPHSAVNCDNSVIWLGNNRDGEAVILRALGPGSPEIISTKGMAIDFGKMASLSDAKAFAYLENGEYFYQITVSNRTFVYQMSVKEWFEKGDFDGGRHRAHTHVFFEPARTRVIGDYANGNLYALDSEVYTDNGSRILRELDSRIISKDRLRQFFNKIILDCETGVGNTDEPNPQVELLYSDDNGRTWSAFMERSLGPVGHYADPPIWNRLGSAVNRVFKVRYAGKTKFNVFSAYGNIDYSEDDE
jgi:hypothetical protein